MKRGQKRGGRGITMGKEVTGKGRDRKPKEKMKQGVKGVGRR